MSEQVFTNARIVLENEIVTGSVRVVDGLISDIGENSDVDGAIDIGGDYLIPGLVELHTDHLENHYKPRPKVFWDPIAALQAHDAQIASSGITTVFDAVRLGTDSDSDASLSEHVAVLMDAIMRGRAEDRLRAEHFVHLRCELATSDALAHFSEYFEYEPVKLASLMDHTPGQRQFTSMELYYIYYQGKTGRTDAEMERFINARIGDQQTYGEGNRAGIVALALASGIVLASHDDASLAHVEEAVKAGVGIAEFPTTLEAARAAHEAGLKVLMGGPNLVRGGSHSGNVSAAELASAGCLDILSSDYVPFSLIQSAFLMPSVVESISLPEAIAMVTRNPAQAVGLDDRGEIGIGKRADLVRVRQTQDVPVVRSVWRAGERVV